MPGSIAPEIHRLGIATAAAKTIILVRFFIFEIFHVIKNIMGWQRHANGNQNGKKNEAFISVITAYIVYGINILNYFN